MKIKKLKSWKKSNMLIQYQEQNSNCVQITDESNQRVQSNKQDTLDQIDNIKKFNKQESFKMDILSCREIEFKKHFKVSQFKSLWGKINDQSNVFKRIDSNTQQKQNGHFVSNGKHWDYEYWKTKTILKNQQWDAIVFVIFSDEFLQEKYKKTEYDFHPKAIKEWKKLDLSNKAFKKQFMFLPSFVSKYLFNQKNQKGKNQQESKEKLPVMQISYDLNLHYVHINMLLEKQKYQFCLIYIPFYGKQITKYSTITYN